MNASTPLPKTRLQYRDLKVGVRFRVEEWPHLEPVQIVEIKRTYFRVVETQEMDNPTARKWTFRARKAPLRKVTLIQA